ncbi:MAG: sugar phosphate isomerase/epimerase [Acidobacteria bacterium]|nr:sugar phosphate isomerase/epimerase [Acidobacteriota bacterium]
MAQMTRRTFLEKTSAGTAAAGVLAAAGVRLHADPLGIPIGSQTYPERQRIAEGKFVEVLKGMYDAGIRQIELCSPNSYAQFKSLADGKATKKVIEDAGLRAVSSHVGMAELRTALPQAIEWAQSLGLTQIGTASLGGVVSGHTSLNQLRYAAEEYNKMASVVKRAGLQMFLHNEGLENSRLEDGRLTYPVLLEYLDPELVKMQFQMSSMRVIGNPIVYFTNHPGRFISAHVHGVNLDTPVAPYAGMPLPIKQTAPAAGRGRGPAVPGIAIGDDSVDWPKVFEAMKIGGVKNYFIEQEQANGWDAMVKGAAYLKTLTV